MGFFGGTIVMNQIVTPEFRPAGIGVQINAIKYQKQLLTRRRNANLNCNAVEKHIVLDASMENITSKSI